MTKYWSCAEMLLSRYLGAKNDLLPEILHTVRRFADPGDRILDGFSGSLSVSMGLKNAGYRVSATDLNLLSYTFAQAYLLPNSIADYAVDAQRLVPAGAPEWPAADEFIEEHQGDPRWSFLDSAPGQDGYRNLLALILRLQNVAEKPSSGPSHFRDAYAPEGKHSAFVSSRGATGERRFFTAANAARLDAMLDQVRTWTLSSEISPSITALLTAVICHASEKVANTQGTWHDFPRDEWDARAFKDLTLQPPSLNSILDGASELVHHHGHEEEVRSYVSALDPVRVAYFDPPYNFRQYTAYYHLPNLMCRYPYLTDVTSYFEGIEFVRGQNMADDRPSQFCSTRSFLPSMKALLDATPAEVVILSYFNGRNHWAKFDSGPDDTGLELLGELLQGENFETGSLEIRRLPRTNYASYGGYTARKVDELLLIARKKPMVSGVTPNINPPAAA